MTRVLVPTAVLEGESISLGLMELLGTMDVLVLGYHELPEQTPPDQARLQYEDRATEALEDITQEFRQAGGDAEYRLVFTPDRKKTIERVAAETGARAYAIGGATGTVDRLLVPLTGEVATDRILSFVVELIGDRDIGVTLFLAAEADSEASEARLASAADHLMEAGIEVVTNLVVDTPPLAGLMDAVVDHDVIVMGEQAPSLRSWLFGDETERIAAESVGPVLVVRRESEDAENERRNAE